MSSVVVVQHVLCETNGSPHCQPVYYLLASPDCNVLIFLCGMQV